MKIQIDTTSKTIKIEEEINLGELFEKLNSLFPDNLWKEYKIDVTVINNWSNPIQIPYIPYIPIQPYPWITPNQPYYWEVTSGDTNCSSGGVYNVQF